MVDLAPPDVVARPARVVKLCSAPADLLSLALPPGRGAGSFFLSCFAVGGRRGGSRWRRRCWGVSWTRKGTKEVPVFETAAGYTEAVDGAADVAVPYPRVWVFRMGLEEFGGEWWAGEDLVTKSALCE